MNRASRYISISVGITAWMMIVSAGFVFAQNYSGIVPVESSSGVKDIANVEDVSFDSVSLNQVNIADEFAAKNTVYLPKFAKESSNYTLGKEDIIEVTILRHPEVSGQFIINSEGNIQYEFIGDIKIEGLKKDEVKAVLTEHLSEYIISPEVTIQIVGYNSKIVYIIGEVGRPGKIYMRGDTITVREALVLAGLPRLTGKVAKSRLFTPSDDGKTNSKIVNVHKLLYEGDLRENLIMNPGDTLYIPPTMMTKAMRVIQPVAAPINTAGSVYPGF